MKLRFLEAARGDRLRPHRLHPRYYILTRLRKVLEEIIAADLAASPPLSALDLGCGSMPYRPLFEKVCRSYVGADIRGNHRAGILIDEAGYVAAPDGSFGLVISTQVLEHVPSPRQYLSEAHRLLEDGGKLLLSTHGHWFYHPDPSDYWRWTGAGLRKAVEDAGFSIIRFSGVVGLAGAAVQLLQEATAQLWPRGFRNVHAALMQNIMSLLDCLVPGEPERDAVVYVILARKAPSPEGADQHGSSAGT